jgi:peptidoglycan/xylan/chitin deacetylase (PgdA/CDA1 family)
VILVYHSIPGAAWAGMGDPGVQMPPAVFERQVSFLARSCQVISLTQLVDLLAEGDSPEPGSVVITFDDGYRDNLRIAAPILRKYELPATLFLPTSIIGRGENQWVDRLHAAFVGRSRNTLEVEPIGRVELNSNVACQQAYSALNQVCVKSGREARDRLIGEVEDQLASSVELPRLTMNWSDVRSLAKEFPSFELGVHGANHVDLTRDPVEAADEVEQSIREFRRELGRDPRHHAFPYHRSDSSARGVVRDAGLSAGLGTSCDEVITGSSDPFSLSRIEPARARGLFRFRASGAYPDLSKLLVGRA